MKKYFWNLHDRTVQRAHNYSYLRIKQALDKGGNCLDCGAKDGWQYEQLKDFMGLERGRYVGIDWSNDSIKEAHKKGIPVIQGDLNKRLPFEDNSFQCVFALSTLEHLLKGCYWINEAKRILNNNGVLVIMTPNISTWMTVVLLILGRMPSSGPHPDSEWLKGDEVALIPKPNSEPKVESDTPSHRHLVVFSYRALKRYLLHCGFSNVQGRTFGLYPFPNFMQPLLEKIDPWHCHQMVFTAVK
ncbi:class I SAM-dependent methyltransferase [Candidatus Omnitrophota bacterium]